MYNYYEAISFMKAYFSKSESDMSSALKQVVNEITNQNFKTKKGTGKHSQPFISARRLSVQEAVYLCLSELWFEKCNL